MINLLIQQTFNFIAYYVPISDNNTEKKGKVAALMELTLYLESYKQININIYYIF